MASGRARSKPAPRSGQRAQSASARPAAPAGPKPPRRPTSPDSPLPTALLGTGLVIGVYAMLPGFFAGGIHLRRGVEVVDHVLPGLFVLVLVVVAIVRSARPDTLMLAAGVGVVLAGFWMLATHLGLASQALNGEAGKAAVAYHCSTALAVGVLGVAWVWRYRSAGTSPPKA